MFEAVIGSRRKRLPGTVDNRTKFLLHMDGANNSTSFLDDSGAVWTPSGTTRLVTSQQVFGPSSGYFPGDGYLATPYSPDQLPGLGDVCVEAWVYLSSPGDCPIFDTRQAGYEGIGFYAGTGAGGASLRLVLNDNAYNVAVSSVSASYNVFTHCVYQRRSGVSRLFMNGASVAAAADARNLNSPAPPRIGANFGAQRFVGLLDEFRYRLEAVYPDTGFTPPSLPYALR